MDALLDEVEAARYLTVSTRTVRRAVERGKLRRVKVEGSTRYRQSELERYLRASERSRAA